jgi:hypothetical protein
LAEHVDAVGAGADGLESGDGVRGAAELEGGEREGGTRAAVRSRVKVVATAASSR